MSSSASVLGLTVRDYFNACNWQLLPPPSCEYLPKQAKKIVSPERPIILSTLSVKEFLNSCNWQLLPQTEPDKDSSFPLSLQLERDFQNPPTVLSCLTVIEFFGLCNWHSLLLEVRTQPLPESPLEPKSPKTWQVQAFFQRIAWEGNTETSRSLQASTLHEFISPASGEMNLNDLSKLF